MFSHLRRIDIEFHSKCNRKCEWCPNKFLDRQSKDEIMDKELFTKLIQELYDNNAGTINLTNDYKGLVFTLIGYCEPFLQINILKEYVNIIKSIFGQNRYYSIIINTNGDYLSDNNLKDLNINQLNIMDYDCKGKEYWIKKLEENKCVVLSRQKNFLTAMYRNIDFIQVLLDWPNNQSLEDRGGSLSPDNMTKQYSWKKDLIPRTYECDEPYYCINISYDGSVMPCCHLRPDNPNHKDYILGNLKEQNLIDIFYEEKAIDFRDLMLSENYDKYPKTCATCHKKRNSRVLIDKFSKSTKIGGKKIKQAPFIGREKQWGKHQVECWEKAKSYSVRDIRNKKQSDKKYSHSLFESLGIWPNEKRAKELYEYYCKNWEILKDFFDYTYISEQNISNYSSEISFKNFPFTIDSLSTEYLQDKGYYQPLMGIYVPGKKFKILGGCHRALALYHLKRNKVNTETETICFSLNCYKENFKGNLYIPKELYDNIFYMLALPYKQSQLALDYYEIEVKDPIDIWIIMKTYEREIDYLVEHWEENFSKYKIKPDHTVINRFKQQYFEV